MIRYYKVSLGEPKDGNNYHRWNLICSDVDLIKLVDLLLTKQRDTKTKFRLFEATFPYGIGYYDDVKDIEFSVFHFSDTTIDRLTETIEKSIKEIS